MGSGCKIVVLALVLGVAFIVNHVIVGMGYNAIVTFNDDNCRLLDAPTPIEDISAFGDGHAFFGGGGDLWKAFEHGSASAKNGGVWLINATRGTMQQLSITGPDPPKKLILHGIFFSQSSSRLYAVNHDVEAGESVEVFNILKGASPVRVEHVATVRSKLFNNYGLNDVVEGVDGEFYVSEWLPFGYPRGGKKSERTIMEHLHKLAYAPIVLSRTRMTRVFRCKLGEVPECRVASERRFVIANGIAASNDRQTIFVSDPGGDHGGLVVALARQSDGTLKYVSEFKPKHVMDNIEMDSDGYLCGGSIPLLYTSGPACDEGLGATKVVDGRTISCGKSPGGMLHISLLGTGNGTQTDLAMHDGSKLNGVSAAMKTTSGKVVMGSPYASGILVCGP